MAGPLAVQGVDAKFLSALSDTLVVFVLVVDASIRSADIRIVRPEVHEVMASLPEHAANKFSSIILVIVHQGISPFVEHDHIVHDGFISGNAHFLGLRNSLWVKLRGELNIVR